MNRGRQSSAGVSEETKKKVAEALDKCEAGVEECRVSEAFQQHLKSQSHFIDYSPNNCIMIASQCPDATYVAGFSTWKSFGDRDHPVGVRAGEKGIMILAPAPYKAEVEVTDALGQKVLNPDGSVQTQTIVKTAFKPAYVFDISQVDGITIDDLSPCHDLTGDVEGYVLLKAAIIQSSDAPITFEEVSGGAKGYYVPSEHRIAIKDGMSEAQTVKTMLHEIAHSKLHILASPEQERLFKLIGEEDLDELAVVAGYGNYRELYENGSRIQGYESITPDVWEQYQTYGSKRAVKEVQAEAVAYVVSQRFGIETGEDYSFPYMASWGSQDLSELKSSLSIIQRASCEMIHGIEHQLEANRIVNSDALAYKINGYGYLIIEESSDGYEYSFYDRKLRPMDGGFIDSDAAMDTAAKDIMIQDSGFESYRIREIDVNRLMDQIGVRDEEVRILARNIATEIGFVREDTEPQEREAIVERVAIDLDTHHPQCIDLLKKAAETSESAQKLLEDASKLVDIDSAMETTASMHIAS